jgi:hypothetical protein
VTKIIGFSGRKQSGKSTSAKFVWTQLANISLKRKRFSFDNETEAVVDLDNGKDINPELPFGAATQASMETGVKIYSFADQLKTLCHNLFNIEIKLMYGTERDKNTFTVVSWNDIPECIRENYSVSYNRKLTIRELLQVVGTDIFRKMFGECWVFATFNKIKNDKYKYAIITDLRFPNEVSVTNEHGGIVIRQLRKSKNASEHSSESALDNFPHGEYFYTINNKGISLERKNKMVWDKIKNAL